jgi:hypothetical protein
MQYTDYVVAGLTTDGSVVEARYKGLIKAYLYRSGMRWNRGYVGNACQ